MAGFLTVGHLPDGRLQGWMYELYGNKLYTFSQTSIDPQGKWSALTEFPMPPAVYGEAYGTSYAVYPDGSNGLTVGSLPDGRLQLWLAGAFGIWTCVMLTADADAQWSAWWQQYGSPSPVSWTSTLRQVPQYPGVQVRTGAAPQAARP
jgi:hypothetical protein